MANRENSQERSDLAGSFLSIAAIIASTLIITYFHYGVSKHHTVIHISHYYAFYIIVIYASYRFGLRGGLFVSVILTLIYSPAAYLHLLHLSLPHYIMPAVVEVSMVYAVALLAGYLSGRLKKEKLKVEKVSKEMLEMERQLAHDDRLRVLGQLSAGIAHEIRNPLAAIKSGISMIKSGKSSEQVTDILTEEIEQLNSFVERFLQYARFGAGSHDEFELETFCGELCELINLAAAGKGVRLRFETDFPEDTKICADKNSLKQALLNLAINGIEAASENPEAVLSMTTSADENMVTFTVTDNGTGIDDDVLDKIFEPFFTTKAEGTGLGLALAAKTASEHNGTLRAEKKEKGTSFIMKISRGGN